MLTHHTYFVYSYKYDMIPYIIYQHIFLYLVYVYIHTLLYLFDEFESFKLRLSQLLQDCTAVKTTVQCASAIWESHAQLSFFHGPNSSAFSFDFVSSALGCISQHCFCLLQSSAVQTVEHTPSRLQYIQTIPLSNSALAQLAADTIEQNNPSDAVRQYVRPFANLIHCQRDNDPSDAVRHYVRPFANLLFCQRENVE